MTLINNLGESCDPIALKKKEKKKLH
jgi:hypothetical protein